MQGLLGSRFFGEDLVADLSGAEEVPNYTNSLRAAVTGFAPPDPERFGRFSWLVIDELGGGEPAGAKAAALSRISGSGGGSPRRR